MSLDPIAHMGPFSKVVVEVTESQPGPYWDVLPVLKTVQGYRVGKVGR